MFFYKKIITPNGLRLSIPLIKGLIDSPAKLTKMVKEFRTEVNEFVIRPLFSITPYYYLKFVDFDFEHPLVKFDRESCDVDKRSNLIWAANNEFYRDWFLSDIYQIPFINHL